MLENRRNDNHFQLGGDLLCNFFFPLRGEVGGAHDERCFCGVELNVFGKF